jgi:hypothetical protein
MIKNPKSLAELAIVPAALAAAYTLAPIKGSGCPKLEAKHHTLHQLLGRLLLLKLKIRKHQIHDKIDSV